MEPDDIARRSVTRRNVLKGGAVLGGVIWTAPVVETLMATPASAQSELHYCCYCFDTVDVNNCGTTARGGPPNTGLTDQGEADGTPTSAADCGCFCFQQGFTTYQWGGPSPSPYALFLGTSLSNQNPSGDCGCFLNKVFNAPVITQTGAAVCG